MLRDLRSVKLRPAERDRLNAVREQFQSAGAIPMSYERWLHDACRRYRGQMEELHAARERAQRTNALRRLGISREQAEARVQERAASEAERANDLGF